MEKLTDDEFREMLSLLSRYGAEVDQWDMFQLPSEAGSVYVSIALEPAPGSRDENYRKLDPAKGFERPSHD